MAGRSRERVNGHNLQRETIEGRKTKIYDLREKRSRDACLGGEGFPASDWWPTRELVPMTKCPITASSRFFY